LAACNKEAWMGLAGAGVAERLAAVGLNVSGVLSADRYDALVPPAWRAARLLPDARSAVVVASGGRALWNALRSSPEYGQRADPVDRYTRRVTEALAQALTREGQRSAALLAFERRDGAYADFVALGRAAGLGAPSRLGLLLHPIYGPWMSIRAVLLTALALPETAPPPGFDPCPGCPAPCAEACPGGAPAPGGFDLARCDATRRREPHCRLDCTARRACVLGSAHAYADEALAHHMAHARPA
jgi:epoxyqueuosine reductase QueG